MMLHLSGYACLLRGQKKMQNKFLSKQKEILR